MATRGPLYIAKVYKHGNSLVMTLERDLRNELGIVEGDLVTIRLHAPFATLRRANASLIVPLPDLDVRDLPPATLDGGTRARE